MKILYQFFLFLISINLNAQEFTETINNHFEKLISNGELLTEDVQWELSSNHISSISGTNHIYYYQTVHGYQILNTLSSIHLLSNGKVLKDNTSFIKNCTNKTKGNSSPSLSAIEVVQLTASQLGYVVTSPLKILNKEIGIHQKTLISNGGFSKYDIPAKLVYLIDDNEELVLTWEVTILENELEHWWNVYINANTGEILSKNDNVFNCTIENNEITPTVNNKPKPKPNLNCEDENLLNCDNCYEVIPMPIESPYYSERVIVTNPVNYNASPFGWHDDGGFPDDTFTVTKGNNVNAFIGTEDNFEYQPIGGENLEFTNYLFDQSFNIDTRYEDASITNLFYWGNIMHDVLYEYGFDEASGNFQTYNFNNGGVEDDSLLIFGQKKLNLCNAGIGIASDGYKPFMYMNACGDKDGAFDNIVVIHEYLHGMSYRLVGGANSNYCLNNVERMEEGWSDWYALMMTMSPNDIGSKPRGIATYLFDQSENGVGIRDWPYTTDMNINPQTYDYIKFNTSTHDVGSVWAAILWELTWVLIEEYGFDENIYNFTGNLDQDAGNVIALAIVTEGMKLQPCESGFIDGRHSIINAYLSIYGDENECLLWQAFAKRGLGLHAVQGSPNSLVDNFEDFTGPPFQAKLDLHIDPVCINANTIYENGGFPLGGVYSGVGVVDSGNGSTFTFEPSIAGIGIHTVIYEIQGSDCNVASSDVDTIEVVLDTVAPEITCPHEKIVTIPLGENKYSLIDFSTDSYINDNCFDVLNINQYPIEGTELDIGNYWIEIEVSDQVGNQSSCAFSLTVEREVEDLENSIDFYPNPVNNELFMSSATDITFLNASIFDINGRLIRTNEFNDFGFEGKLNLENLETGMYFLKINTADFSIIKRLIKK